MYLLVKHSSFNLQYIDFALGLDIFDTCDDVSSMVENPLAQQMQVIYNIDNLLMNKSVNEAINWSIDYIKLLNIYLDWIDPA